jgi:hypothetical protein
VEGVVYGDDMSGGKEEREEVEREVRLGQRPRPGKPPASGGPPDPYLAPTPRKGSL